MKYFILILISLITLIIFASYGLIQTSSADKETGNSITKTRTYRKKKSKP